jgi:phosphinothricin acetyltransferase
MSVQKPESGAKRKPRVRLIRESDWPAVVDIFNYFVRESYAAYPEKEVSVDRFRTLIRSVHVFVVLQIGTDIVGFGFLKPYREEDNFSHSGMVAYFILPHYTGMGLGERILQRLIREAKKRGITNLVAHISSKNTQSLRFHARHGFEEVGRLKEIGTKFNTAFDIVWVQKFL